MSKFTVALTGGLVRSNQLGKTNIDPAMSAVVADLEVQGGGQIVVPDGATIAVPFHSGLVARVVRVVPDQDVGVQINGGAAIPVAKGGEFLLMRTVATSVHIVNESGSRATAQVFLAGTYTPPS